MRCNVLAPLFISVALVACGSSNGGDPPTVATPDASVENDGATPDAVRPPPSCTVVAPTMCPEAASHYADVAPIIQRRCVTCHSGDPDGPWPLTDYRHVSDWRDAVRDELIACSMPPPDAGMPMEDEERLAILEWIRCGLPQ